MHTPAMSSGIFSALFPFFLGEALLSRAGVSPFLSLAARIFLWLFAVLSMRGGPAKHATGPLQLPPYKAVAAAPTA